MRIRIVQEPSIHDLDGVDLTHFQVGTEYDVGISVASVLLAEGWAEPLPLDAPSPPAPFGPDDPFSISVIRNKSPTLVKDHSAPFLDRGVAADLHVRRGGRRRKN